MLELVGFCSAVASSRKRCSVKGQSFAEPLASESPSALLSEIGNPFSWTRFLASCRGDRKDDMLHALDSDGTRKPLGFYSLWAVLS